MKLGGSLNDFYERFSSILIELASLGNDYTNREVALKVMGALSSEWGVKTIATRKSKKLNKLELHELFVNLKAYDFELATRNR